MSSIITRPPNTARATTRHGPTVSLPPKVESSSFTKLITARSGTTKSSTIRSKPNTSTIRPRLHPNELSRKIAKFFSPTLFPRGPDRAPVPPSLAYSRLPPPCAELDPSPTRRIRRFKKWRDVVPELRLVLLDPRKKGHLIRYQNYALPYSDTFQRGVKRKIYPRGAEILDYASWPKLDTIRTRRLAKAKKLVEVKVPNVPLGRASAVPASAAPHIRGPERRQIRTRMIQHRWVLHAENERRWRLGMREFMARVTWFQEGCMLEPTKWENGKGVWLPDFEVKEVVKMTKTFRDIRRQPGKIFDMTPSIQPVPGRKEAENAIREDEAKRKRRKDERRDHRNVKALVDVDKTSLLEEKVKSEVLKAREQRSAHTESSPVVRLISQQPIIDGKPKSQRHHRPSKAIDALDLPPGSKSISASSTLRKSENPPVPVSTRLSPNKVASRPRELPVAHDSLDHAAVPSPASSFPFDSFEINLLKALLKMSQTIRTNNSTQGFPTADYQATNSKQHISPRLDSPRAGQGRRVSRSPLQSSGVSSTDISMPPTDVDTTWFGSSASTVHPISILRPGSLNIDDDTIIVSPDSSERSEPVTPTVSRTTNNKLNPHMQKLGDYFRLLGLVGGKAFPESDTDISEMYTSLAAESQGDTVKDPLSLAIHTDLDIEKIGD